MILNVLAVCTIVVRTLRRALDPVIGCDVRVAPVADYTFQLVKILVADDLPASALDLLREEGWDIDARTGRTPEQLADDLKDADAIVVRSATRVTSALIDAAPRLRAIARAGTGVDNVDVPAASCREASWS